MKRVLSALLFAALVLNLTGCAGKPFERSYSSVTAHQEQAASDEDASILRAETYADLVSCVQHFVTMAQETGTVHVYNYTGDIAADLENACNEIRTEDPLGAYALEDIRFEYSRIVSYYECNFTLSYRHSLSEMNAIVNAYSGVAIREQLETSLSSFERSLTLRTSDYYAVPADLYSRIQDAYYASPGTAFGYPDVTISIYPDSGEVRIVEIQFSYPLSQDSLLQRKESVAAAAALLVGQETAVDSTVAWLFRSRLLETAVYTPSGSSSVYNALCSVSGADSEGLALAYQLLCDLGDIPCLTVQGTLDGVPHCWNLITLDETSWMMDVTRDDGETNFLHSDDFMSGSGYTWSRDDYPVCDGEEALPESETEDDLFPADSNETEAMDEASEENLSEESKSDSDSDLPGER